MKARPDLISLSSSTVNLSFSFLQCQQTLSLSYIISGQLTFCANFDRISARHRSSPVTSTTSVDPATETTTTHKLDLTGWGVRQERSNVSSSWNSINPDTTLATSLQPPRHHRPLECTQPSVRLCLVVGVTFSSGRNSNGKLDLRGFSCGGVTCRCCEVIGPHHSTAQHSTEEERR
ncbi:uncharacterized protein LOC123502273 isoform X3 [Portunus trituberculatus]|uniref:uncharacterized protein LOC123502273 isoform X2 n=1 Tax=Portunus trituberculatus TaxID=210409 RepID=UPI001E1CEDB6|nr:uncharacterized protein LOC123502273 isoform X2 [Portunus trituberculatus]XP_045107427.1 uncharacterized protein LOC123502273 isoform X3 [Portunus trituberculatus]